MFRSLVKGVELQLQKFAEQSQLVSHRRHGRSSYASTVFFLDLVGEDLEAGYRCTIIHALNFEDLENARVTKIVLHLNTRRGVASPEVYIANQI